MPMAFGEYAIARIIADRQWVYIMVYKRLELGGCHLYMHVNGHALDRQRVYETENRQTRFKMNIHKSM